MPPIPKRSLAELRARYTLLHTIADVYVEGTTDQAAMQWYFCEKELHHLHAYPVESVEIPDDVYIRLKLEDTSHRSMVIALAAALEAECRAISPRVACVADRDFGDHMLGCHETKFLLFTDYTSMEMYLFNCRFLRKFLAFVVGVPANDAPSILNHMAKVLTRCYLMRLTNEVLQWRMTLPECDRYLTWHGLRPELDEEALLKAYLRANSRLHGIDTFRATMKQLASRFGADPRTTVRGHDYTGLLFSMTKAHDNSRIEYSDVLALERELPLMLEESHMDGTKLFSALVKL